MATTDDWGGTLVQEAPKSAAKPATDNWGGVEAPESQPSSKADDWGGIEAPVAEKPSAQQLIADPNYDPAAHAAQSPDDYETAFQARQALKHRSFGEKAGSAAADAFREVTGGHAFEGALKFAEGLVATPLHTAAQIGATVAAPVDRALGDERAAQWSEDEQQTQAAEATLAAQKVEQGLRHAGRGIRNVAQDLFAPENEARERAHFNEEIQNYRDAQQLAQQRPLETGAVASAAKMATGTDNLADVYSPEALASHAARQVAPIIPEMMASAGDPINLLLPLAGKIPGVATLAGGAVQAAGKTLSLPANIALKYIPKIAKAAKVAEGTATGIEAAGLIAHSIYHPATIAAAAAAGLGKLIGDSLDAQGAALRTGIPSALDLAAQSAASAGERAIGTNAQRLVGNMAGHVSSTAIGFAPINYAIAGGDPREFAEAEVNAGVMGALFALPGETFQNRPQMAGIAAYRLAQHGAQQLTDNANYSAHQAQMAKFASSDQSAINRLRSYIFGSTGADVLVLDGPTYAATVGKIGGDTRGHFAQDAKTIYLNADAIAPSAKPSERAAKVADTSRHEAGHAIVDFLKSAGREGDANGLFNTISATMTPEQRAALVSEYHSALSKSTKAQPGETPAQRADIEAKIAADNPPEKILEENLSEIVRKILSGEDVASFTLPKPLTERITDATARFLEARGLLPKIDTGATLGFKAQAVREAIRQTRTLLYEGGQRAQRAAEQGRTVVQNIMDLRAKLAAFPPVTPDMSAVRANAISRQRDAVAKELAQAEKDAGMQQGAPPTPFQNATAKGQQPVAPSKPTAPVNPNMWAEASASSNALLALKKLFGGTIPPEYKDRLNGAIAAAKAQGVPVTIENLTRYALSGRFDQPFSKASAEMGSGAPPKGTAEPSGGRAGEGLLVPQPKQGAPDGGIRDADSSGNDIKGKAVIPETSGDINVPRSGSIGGDATLPQGIIQNAASDVQTLSNVASTKSFREKGLSGIDAPSRWIVMKGMAAAIHNREILDAIIKLIPVDVVNNLRARQLTPEMALHDESVLKALFSGNLANPIAMPSNVADGIIRMVANSAAKMSPAISESPRSNIETGSALGATNVHGERSNPEIGAESSDKQSAEGATVPVTPKYTVKPDPKSPGYFHVYGPDGRRVDNQSRTRAGANASARMLESGDTGGFKLKPNPNPEVPDIIDAILENGGIHLAGLSKEERENFIRDPHLRRLLSTDNAANTPDEIARLLGPHDEAPGHGDGFPASLPDLIAEAYRGRKEGKSPQSAEDAQEEHYRKNNPEPNEPTTPEPHPGESIHSGGNAVLASESPDHPSSRPVPIPASPGVGDFERLAAAAHAEFLADKPPAKSGPNKGKPRKDDVKAAEKAAFDAAAAAHGESVPLNFEGMRQRTNTFGEKSVSGKVDPSRPFDAWLIARAKKSGMLTNESLKTLLEFQDAIGTSVSYDYGHAKVEPQEKGEMQTAEERAASQAKNTVAKRLSGESEQDTARKTSMPLRVGFNSGNDSFTVYGASQEKLLNNFNHLTERMADLKIPIPFRDINDPRFVSAFKAVIRNHENGWKGDGSEPAKGTEEFPNTPNPDWAKSPDHQLVPKEQFEFINALLGDESMKAQTRDKSGPTPEAKAKARLANENDIPYSPEGEPNELRYKINEATESVNGKPWSKATIEDPLNENISPALASNIGEASQSDESIRQHGKVGDLGRFFPGGKTPDRAKTAAGFMPDEASEAGAEERGPQLKKRAAALWKEKGTESPFFKKWFGESKVVNTEGKPAVVYHGTDAPFNKVNMKKGAQGVFWFTSDKASIESGDAGAQGRGAIMEMYASIKNPAGWDEYGKKSIGELIRDGYDGVILPDGDGSFNGIIFEPNQVKLAAGNKGTFDANNKDMRFMPDAEEPKGVREKARERIAARTLEITKGVLGTQETTQSRARQGGEVGPNGEWYPGGAFIATTEMPKKLKSKLQKMATGRVQVTQYESGKPTEYAVPEPGKMSILDKMGGGQPMDGRDGSINQQFVKYNNVAPERVAAWERAAEKYRAGERWADVNEFPELANVIDAARLLAADRPIPGAVLESLPEEYRAALTKYRQPSSGFMPDDSTDREAKGPAGTPPKRESGSPLHSGETSANTASNRDQEKPAVAESKSGDSAQNENLAQEAEDAGVILKIDDLKGLIARDPAVMDSVRARIKARTGNDARFMPDGTGVKIRAVQDELRRWMKGQVAIWKMDSDEKAEWLREFGIKSHETGRKLRYTYQLSDGRIVSADGALKITNPDAYQRIKDRFDNLNAEKARVEIWKALPEEVKTQIADDLPYEEISEIDANPTEAAQKYLKREGHILSGIATQEPRIANRVMLLQDSKYLAKDTPQEAAQDFRKRNHSPFRSFEDNDRFFFESNLWEKGGKFIRKSPAAEMDKIGWTKVEPDPVKQIRGSDPKSFMPASDSPNAIPATRPNIRAMAANRRRERELAPTH